MVRINSRLTDTRSGVQIWAERFDRKLDDIFALQDDVTGRIVEAMEIKLTPEDEGRLHWAERVTSPEVYDLYLRGVDALRQYTPESIRRSRTYFFQVLANDPDYAQAYAWLAFSYVTDRAFYFGADEDGATDKAMLYAQRALKIDPQLPLGYFALSSALLRKSRADEAVEAAKNAVNYDPNYAEGYGALASALNYAGRGEKALDAIKRAMELNPDILPCISKFSAGPILSAIVSRRLLPILKSAYPVIRSC
jgi:adenylate cyclase